MSPENPTDIALEPGDFYRDGEFMVFTAQYLLKQGYCCGNNCRHCPYGNSDADRAALVK